MFEWCLIKDRLCFDLGDVNNVVVVVYIVIENIYR